MNVLIGLIANILEDMDIYGILKRIDMMVSIDLFVGIFMGNHRARIVMQLILVEIQNVVIGSIYGGLLQVKTIKIKRCMELGRAEKQMVTPN